MQNEARQKKKNRKIITRPKMLNFWDLKTLGQGARPPAPPPWICCCKAS